MTGDWILAKKDKSILTKTFPKFNRFPFFDFYFFVSPAIFFSGKNKPIKASIKAKIFHPNWNVPKSSVDVNKNKNIANNNNLIFITTSAKFV